MNLALMFEGAVAIPSVVGLAGEVVVEQHSTALEPPASRQRSGRRARRRSRVAVLSTLTGPLTSRFEPLNRGVKPGFRSEALLSSSLLGIYRASDHGLGCFPGPIAESLGEGKKG